MFAILDIVVAALLVVTIGYAVVLNKRLAALRGDRSELEKLAKEFGNATARAEKSILTMKLASDEAAGSLRDGLGDAKGLRDDLVYLIERGETAAGKLEKFLRSARDEPILANRATEKTEKRPTSIKTTPNENRTIETGPAGESSQSDAERDLLKALQAIR